MNQISVWIWGLRALCDRHDGQTLLLESPLPSPFLPLEDHQSLSIPVLLLSQCLFWCPWLTHSVPEEFMCHVHWSWFGKFSCGCVRKAQGMTVVWEADIFTTRAITLLFENSGQGMELHLWGWLFCDPWEMVFIWCSDSEVEQTTNSIPNNPLKPQGVGEKSTLPQWRGRPSVSTACSVGAGCGPWSLMLVSVELTLQTGSQPLWIASHHYEKMLKMRNSQKRRLEEKILSGLWGKTRVYNLWIGGQTSVSMILWVKKADKSVYDLTSFCIYWLHIW